MRAILFFIVACANITYGFLTASAQVEVRNGGDIILCRVDPDSRFQGHYFLDYVVTYDEALGDDVFHQGNDILADIARILSRTYPALGFDLQEFIDQAHQQIGSRPDFTQRFIWIPEANGVVTLHDEELAFLSDQFPENCTLADPGPDHDIGLELLQVINHEDRGQSRIFKYTRSYMQHIVDQPLQYSFMILHEWLWAFTNRAAVVRDANRFLHLKEIEDYDRYSLKLALTNLGLDLSLLPRQKTKALLTTRDISEIDSRVVNFDRDLGVEIQIVNSINSYWRLLYRRLDEPDFNILAIRPTNDGSTAIFKETFFKDALFSICHCNPDTQQCTDPVPLLTLVGHGQ